MKGNKMNLNHSSNWGWMLYTDFFLGALGGGLLIIGSLTVLFYGQEYTSIATFIAPVIAMGLGSSMLVLELGNPFRAWRVITNPQSFLTIGAILMTLSIGLSVLLATFQIQILPWSHFTGIQNMIAIIAILTGLGVAFYPGLLLGGMNNRPFWRGPFLAPLFLLSGLSTGLVIFSFTDMVWRGNNAISPGYINNINVFLLALQIIGWVSYVNNKLNLPSAREDSAMSNIFTGTRRLVFWGGFIGLGLVIPIIIYLSSLENLTVAAHVFVLIGAFMMRGFVVTADEGVPLEFSR